MDEKELNDYAVGPESPPKYSAEPRGRRDGYRRLAEEDYPPNPSYYPPPMQPLPAPIVQQQQSSNTNVVVMGQPQAQPQVVSVRTRRASTFVSLTAVLLVLCLLHMNLPAFICLVPALICACVASDHNDAGEYENAKTCGNMALFCDLLSIIYFVIVTLAVVACVIAVFIVGWHVFRSFFGDVDISNIDTNSLCKNGQICQHVEGIYQCIQC